LDKQIERKNNKLNAIKNEMKYAEELFGSVVDENHKTLINSIPLKDTFSYRNFATTLSNKLVELSN
jgi:hypothetical protein